MIIGDGSSSLLIQLATLAVRGLALASGAGLALAVFRVKSSALRLFTWSAVLYAILVVSLIGWMLPPLRVAVPSLAFLAVHQGPGERSANVAAPKSASRPRDASQASVEAEKVPAVDRRLLSLRGDLTQPPVATLNSSLSRISWNTLASFIYVAVALLLLARIAVGLIFTRRLLRASQPVNQHAVADRLAGHAKKGDLRALPLLAECESVAVPLTVGIFRPAILLPPDWTEWETGKLDAVLAHEVSHIARHDALTQFVSLVHRAIFWFSPLAWWLDRHLAELAEQASDDAALSGGADRTGYARTLLEFFETLHAAPQRVWWQGVSMAHAGRAEQRLERILSWKGTVAMNLKKSLVIAILAFAVPAVYVAASVRPANRQQNSPPAPGQTAGEAPAAPETSLHTPPSAPALADGGVINSGPPPVRPIAPVAPIEPVQAWSPAASDDDHGFAYAYSFDDDEPFVIVTGKTDAFTMSGTSADARHVQKLRKQIAGDFIWFRRDEKSYIVRDQATIARAQQLWAPQEELGKKQEELGKQQEKLGKEQEELGAKMERIHVKVPDLTAELDKLRAELKELSSGATAEQVAKIQAEIGELQSKIGEVQSHAGDQQSELGEQMGRLGEMQGKLGEQQEELGHRQAELARDASRRMRDLLDDAIKNGKAQPEPQAAGAGTL